jgi:hypothetical protein
MPFEPSDYASAQIHLNLPVAQLLEGSYLRSQFTNIENIDEQLGVDLKVSYVQNLLSLLDDLKGGLDSDRAEELTIGVKLFEEKDGYRVAFGDKNESGLLGGKQQQYEKYLVELKRELGYEFTTDYHQQIGALVV